MNQIVVDTDIASYIFNWHSSAKNDVDALRGSRLVLCFMSVAEMRTRGLPRQRSAWVRHRRQIIGTTSFRFRSLIFLLLMATRRLFDSKATNVRTPPEEVLKERKGVWQDVALLWRGERTFRIMITSAGIRSRQRPTASWVTVMRSRPAVPFLLIAASATIGAQAPNVFEVASLKPSRPGARLTSTLDAAQFRCTAHTLMHLLMSAYPDIEIQPWKVSGGPAWLNSDTWDLSAKLPPNMPTEQEPLYRRTEQMLRNFLTEEFKLSTHRETREFPVYGLVIAKNGSKLKPSAGNQFNVKFGRGHLEFHHQSMSGLAEYLYTHNAPIQQAADRPVIDQTGLQGFFDFTLEWTPDTSQPDPAASGPSIYTAIEQQLGLKLQPEKSPVDFLVIDHAEKPAIN